MRRILLAASLLATLLAPLTAFAQAPPAVPALPDSERRTSYSISGSTCACAVNLALYGDGSDVDAWLQVWINGVQYLSSDANHGWSLSSVTGPLSTIPRPITDAVLTFNSVQTGTVQIVGARRPRQLSQFTEGRGVAARDLNQRFTDITAVERELWDKTNDLTGRGLFFAPGNMTGPMPAPSSCIGMNLNLGSNGLSPTCVPPQQTVFVPTGSSPVVNSYAVNHTINTADCGTTAQLTGALTTLTVPSISGFPTQCVVTIANGSSTRGQIISSDPGCAPTYHILWPSQTCIIGIVSGAWAAIQPAGKWKLTSSVTFNVDHSSGSPTNDGLASGSGAFAGINAALAEISFILDAQQQGVTVQVNCGSAQTYSENITLAPITNGYIGGAIGSNIPTLIGNISTPDNCLLNGTGGQTILAIGSTTMWGIEGFKVDNTTSNCTVVDRDAWIRAAFMDYYSCNAGGGNQIVAENNGLYEVDGNHQSTAASNAFIYTTAKGEFLWHSGTFTCGVTNPAYTTAFAYSTDNSYQNWVGMTFSGTCQGARYNALLGGGIQTNGGGATFLPGNAGGTATAPGWYN